MIAAAAAGRPGGPGPVPWDVFQSIRLKGVPGTGQSGRGGGKGGRGGGEAGR
jgi:hypothetical protein